MTNDKKSSKIQSVFNGIQVNLKEIKKIYSHPQGYNQCLAFLKSHNLASIEFIPSKSTAQAAYLASQDKNAAAICSKIAAKLYNVPILFSTLNTAEFIKYLSNTMLAVNISFANEMSMIAQNIGDIDIKKSFEILHQDKRFHGNPAGIASYIYPGLGFGGYCLPKDTLALHKKAKEKNFDAKILQSTLKTNDEILEFYVQKISSEVPKDKKLCILGLSFKPNSDDVRDSKSAALIKGLLQAGYSNIIAYDPMAIEVFKNTYNLNINYAQNLQEAIKDSIIIIATAWEEFRDILNQDNIYNLRFM